MINNFTPRIMQKVSDLFKQIEEAIEEQDRKKWIRVKASLWIIVDDLCERFETTYNDFVELKNMAKIENKAVQQVYAEWHPIILEYLEENHEKEPITPSKIANYFNWDIVVVRAVIDQMMKDGLLQVCKKWL